MSSATDAPAPRRGFDPVAYLKLFRFPLVFTAIADSAAGYLVMLYPVVMGPTSVEQKVNWSILGRLAVASAGLYFFGMSMNDIADRKRDREMAPNRVIPSGRISVAAAVIASLLCLGISLGAVVTIPGSPLIQRLLPWLTAVGAILAYDWFLKIPPTMGVVRAANLLLGFMTADKVDLQAWFHGDYSHIILLGFPALLYVTSLTFVSTLEDGPVRKTLLKVGVSGMIVAAFLAGSWFRLMDNVFSPFRLPADPRFWVMIATPPGPAWFAWAILAGLLIYRAIKAKEPKGIMLLVRDGVGGIILLDAILVLASGKYMAGLLLAGLVLPAALSVSIFKRLA